MDREQIQELAKKAKRGDKQALEDFLVEPSLRAMMFSIARDILPLPDVEDVMQEILLKIPHALQIWQEHGHILTYIRPLARNTCIDVKRRNSYTDTFAVPLDEHPALEYDPIEAAAKAGEEEKTAMLEEALKEMDSPCQDMLTDFLIEKIPKREIKKNVPWRKSAFHEKWKRCCEVLTVKIQRIMKK